MYIKFSRSESGCDDLYTIIHLLRQQFDRTIVSGKKKPVSPSQERKGADGRGTTRGKRFHATSLLLITSCAANDETTMYYFTDCFRLDDHPRPSSSNTLRVVLNLAIHSCDRSACLTDLSTNLVTISSRIGKLFRETD